MKAKSMFVAIVQLLSKINFIFLARFCLLLFSLIFLKQNQQNLSKRGWSSSFKGQISKVEDCKLKRIGNLAIEMDSATCTATETDILMCFPWNNYKQCYKAIITNLSDKTPFLQLDTNLSFKIKGANTIQYNGTN